MSTLSELIQKRLEEIAVLCSSLERTLRTSPEGKLRVSTFRNKARYYQVKENKSTQGKYLRKNEQDLAMRLAQKDYDTRFIKTAEKLAKTLDWMIRIGAQREIHYVYQTLAEVYTNLPEHRRKLVIPYVLPDDLFVAAWKDVKYEGKGFWEDNPEIVTDNGERVRSKSEKMIADWLLKMNIPYRYEFPLETEDLGIVFPDFTILDVWNRRNIILEHFGLIEEEGPRRRMINKFNAYINEGYHLGDDFLFTMEADNLTLDTRYLE